MQHHSLVFALFFVVVVLADGAITGRARGRLALLLAANAVFYASWDWRLLWVPVVLAAFSFHTGQQIARSEDEAERLRVLRRFLVATVGAVVALSFGGLFVPLPHPVGISFMVLSAISYPIDVRRRTCEPITNRLAFLASVSLFPTVTSGPITRPRDVVPKILSRAAVDGEALRGAVLLIAIGLFKKTSADLLGVLIEPYYATSTLSSSGAWAASLGYMVQLYADFSGYSDIAVGVAMLLGIDVPRNFSLPLLSKSPVEFWRRWHITLSLWLRDYVYVALGLRTPIRSLFLTWIIGGLWHGPSWNIVVWAVYNASLIVGTGLLARWVKLKRSTLRRLAVLRWLLTMYLWILGCVLFHAKDLPTAWRIVRTAHSWDGMIAYPHAFAIATAVIVAITGHLLDGAAESKALTPPRRILFYGVVLVGCLTWSFVVNAGAAAFIYAQF